MSKCQHCKHGKPDDLLFCDFCIHQPELQDQFAPMTTADRIRAMNDLELAGFLAGYLAKFTTALYDGKYAPDDKVVTAVPALILKDLQTVEVENDG